VGRKALPPAAFLEVEEISIPETPPFGNPFGLF
jgi:hypothetical protein